MRWQWWFFSNTNNQALWSPGPWSSCSLPRGLPCGEGCLLFKLTSKRSFTSSFYPQILLTSSINFRCALPISLLLSWISALAPSFRLSRHEDTSSRYNWIHCGLFFGAINYSSISLSAQSQSCHVDCSQPSCVLSSWSQWSVISFNDISLFQKTEPYLCNHDSSCHQRKIYSNTLEILTNCAQDVLPSSLWTEAVTTQGRDRWEIFFLDKGDNHLWVHNIFKVSRGEGVTLNLVRPRRKGLGEQIKSCQVNWKHLAGGGMGKGCRVL